MFKKIIITLLLAISIIPANANAYSDRIIAGGENKGISLNSKGVLIVGTYEVNGQNLADKAGLKTGDIIQNINGQTVENIEDMASKINDSASSPIKIKFLRNDKEKETTLELYKDENDVYKTGLYVKDSVTGIGTLTFIDPETKKFGALGHEIEEQTTGKILEIKDGKIFETTVTGIIPSTDGSPGEKKAEYDPKNVISIGEIEEFKNIKLIKDAFLEYIKYTNIKERSDT